MLKIQWGLNPIDLLWVHHCFPPKELDFHEAKVDVRIASFPSLSGSESKVELVH